MQAEVLRSRGKVLEAMALFDQTLTLDPYNIHATMLKASLFVHILSFQSPFLQGTCWKQLNQSEKVQYFTALCGAFTVVAAGCAMLSARAGDSLARLVRAQQPRRADERARRPRKGGLVMGCARRVAIVACLWYARAFCVQNSSLVQNGFVLNLCYDRLFAGTRRVHVRDSVRTEDDKGELALRSNALNATVAVSNCSVRFSRLSVCRHHRQRRFRIIARVFLLLPLLFSC